MENYFNIVHFVLYRMIYKLHLVTERFNPINLIHKLPFQKRRYQELGIDIYDQINRIWGDKQSGLSIQAAGGFLCGVLGLFFFSLLMLFRVQVSIFVMLGPVIASITACYLLVFRGNKYLAHFAKLEKCTKNDRRKYNCLTVGSIFLVFIFFYACLVI
ncbi:hypothetical protein [Sphingobacterium sp. MYb388]|uniref:hypothetical protein n=1 Tax=Sphingobacterium sp. MYb388 TaxID=2745437 RepID=UPI0030B77252